MGLEEGTSEGLKEEKEQENWHNYILRKDFENKGSTTKLEKANLKMNLTLFSL